MAPNFRKGKWSMLHTNCVDGEQGGMDRPPENQGTIIRRKVGDKCC